MKEKEKYLGAECEIILFGALDIITTSGGGDDTVENWGSGGNIDDGGWTGWSKTKTN